MYLRCVIGMPRVVCVGVLEECPGCVLEVCYMDSPGGNSRVAVLASIIAALAAAAAAVFIGMTERG